MTLPIADTLVLMFTRGLSLGEWDRTGLLGREWSLYSRLGHHLRRIILVTYGGPKDLEYKERFAAELPTGCGVEIVCNTGALPIADYTASLPARVAAMCVGRSPVIVKTNQFAAGKVACDVRDTVIAGGARTVLIARGGYLWSRFAAHEHGPDSEQAKAAGAAEVRLCSAADAIIGTTADMTSDLCWRYRLDPARVNIIPNFVLTPDESSPEPQREPGLILYAGQLVQRKRVDVLIQAVALLGPELRERVRLSIVGDGPELDNLKTLAGGLKIRCEFDRRIPHAQLMDRMRRCCIYAQASSLEGHPKTVIEAMAAGAAVVVADSPGLGEVVENGVTGVRVPGNEPAGFANAFTGLLDDSDWRDLLGASAAKAARSRFSLDTIVEMELAVYERALRNTAFKAA